MISLLDDNQCCGCGACAQLCPKSCITMCNDERGFLYPNVDLKSCVDCHLCENVCPIINSEQPRECLVVYATINPNEEIRLRSSSGGIFTALGEYIINHDGVVFGARFNDQFNVVHDYSETLEGLAQFRGSKYLQSVIGNAFLKAEIFLKQGRQVLFSGTPCQIAGLRRFLRKEYDNLLAVEIACHGVPSPKVWQEFIRGENVSEVNFRDKQTGWKNYSVTIGDKSRLFYHNDFMNCFLADYSVRPSCFNCKVKNGASQADITLSDLWGINHIAPEIDDDKGTSGLIIWTSKASALVDKLDLNKKEVNFANIVRYNPAIVKSVNKPSKYRKFWKLFKDRPQKAINKFAAYNRPSFSQRIKIIIYKMFFS